MLSACLPKAAWLAFMSVFRSVNCLEIYASESLYCLSPCTLTFVLMPSLLFAMSSPPHSECSKKGIHVIYFVISYIYKYMKY